MAEVPSAIHSECMSWPCEDSIVADNHDECHSDADEKFNGHSRRHFHKRGDLKAISIFRATVLHLAHRHWDPAFISTLSLFLSEEASMFRPAFRTATVARAIPKAPTGRRFASTSTRRTGTWKGAALRWTAAGAIVYYYNTSTIFADEPYRKYNSHEK